VAGVLRRPRDLSPRLLRWWRYAATSGVSTMVSEVTVVALYAEHFLGASSASVVASLVGAVPSYLLSRYWIWPEADRAHMARQAVSFAVVALVSLVIASLVTGVAAANAPGGHVAHVAVVGITYVGVYGLLWVAKFVVYQTTLFRSRPADEEHHAGTA
jgi:putative flippase GtrA